MKALWLASWYPSKLKPFDGDFIQRHARAVSALIPVHVVHAVKDEEGTITKDFLLEENRVGNLTETIIYYKAPLGGIPFLHSLLSHEKFKRVLRLYLHQLCTKNKFDLVHVHVPFKLGLLGMELKEKYGLPLFVTEHWSIYFDHLPGNFNTQPVFYRNIVEKTFHAADAIHCVSQAVGEQIRKKFSLPAVHVIPNTVDAARFTYSSHPPKDKFSFIHVSIMNYPKNIEGILLTLSKLATQRTDWEMIMVGPASAEQVGMAEQLGLKNFIRWTGEIAHDKVAEELKNADALLMFSRYENQPCAILEALCCGLPVIASMVGGIAELINQNNGLLVHSENQDELLQAVLQMISDNRQYDRTAISASAKKDFSNESVAALFIDWYRKKLSL